MFQEVNVIGYLGQRKIKIKPSFNICNWCIGIFWKTTCWHFDGIRSGVVIKPYMGRRMTTTVILNILCFELHVSYEYPKDGWEKL